MVFYCQIKSSKYANQTAAGRIQVQYFFATQHPVFRDRVFSAQTAE